MECKNPIVRLAIFGRIKRMVNTFKDNKLRTFDRRLIRGLFLRNLKDFDEDYQEMIANKSLLDRIRGAMNQSFEDSVINDPNGGMSSSDMIDHDFIYSHRGNDSNR